MRPVRLPPVRAEAPSCEAFDDIEKVRAYELAVRAHRALTEPFTVRRPHRPAPDASRP